MNRSLIRGFGVALLVWGMFLSLDIPTFTGFIFFEGLTGRFSLGLGLVFIVGGIFLLTANRVTTGKLEQTMTSSPATQGAPRIFISRVALERADKDKYIRENWGAYLKEIHMIQGDTRSRPQERIGKFSVSPRGHKTIRVAWHYDAQTNSLYVDDLLYHKGDLRYNDNWNGRVADGKITRETYAAKGYQPLER